MSRLQSDWSLVLREGRRAVNLAGAAVSDSVVSVMSHGIGHTSAVTETFPEGSETSDDKAAGEIGERACLGKKGHMPLLALILTHLIFGDRRILLHGCGHTDL